MNITEEIYASSQFDLDLDKPDLTISKTLYWASKESNKHFLNTDLKKNKETLRTIN